MDSGSGGQKDAHYLYKGRKVVPKDPLLAPAQKASRDVVPRYTQYTSRNHAHRHWGGQCEAQGGPDRICVRARVQKLCLLP